MLFYVNNSNAMTIDSSGNLLVGGTSAFGADTITLGTGGFAGIRNTGGACLELRRDSSDGSILDFQKDGTTVGSIGTEGGDLTIGNADTGLQFVNTSQIIRPQNLTTNAAIDAQVDLGQSAYRFKDLYLSGTANTAGVIAQPAISGGDALLTAAHTNSNAYVHAGVKINAGNTNPFYIYQSGSSGNLRFNYNSMSDSGGQMILDTSGRLLVGYSAADGIGGSPSDNNFSELGKGYINLNRDDTATARQVQFGKNGVVAGYIETAGSSTSYVTSSDQRLKENIADADDAGSKIDAIQVRQYDWKADGSHQDYGMIAQELQTVAPEAVSGDADSEEMMGVDYSKLVPMLIKEIQSLRNRVAQLEE
jgi:hypothetical protein